MTAMTETEKQIRSALRKANATIAQKNSLQAAYKGYITLDQGYITEWLPAQFYSVETVSVRFIHITSTSAGYRLPNPTQFAKAAEVEAALVAIIKILEFEGFTVTKKWNKINTGESFIDDLHVSAVSK